VPASASNGSIGSDVANVILPAHRRKAAEPTQEHIVGRRWEFAALDGVDRARKLFLRGAQDLIAIAPRREERRYAPGAAERDVRGLAERPAPAVMAVEPLLGAQPVDRQLERARFLRRRRQLVVD